MLGAAMESRVEQIYMSERLGSSHGPDVFYEFVYARVSPGGDAVLLRRVRGSFPEEYLSAEIHVADLGVVQERFDEFVDRVRRRIDPSAATGRPAAPPPAPAPLGRYAPDAPRRKTGTPPAAVSMGPKKASDWVVAGTAAASAAPLFEKDPEKPPPAPPPAAPKPQGLPTAPSFEIVTYSLSSPPTADAVLKLADALPGKLIVVARTDLALKVEQYLQLLPAARRDPSPDDFIAVLVPRDTRKGPVGGSKRSAALTLELQRVFGMTKGVLWMPP